MAIDPRIALAGQVPDFGRTFGNALLNVQRSAQIQQAEEQQPARKRLLEAQATAVEQGLATPTQQLAERDLNRLSSIANFSQITLPKLAAGDIDGTRSDLLSRREFLLGQQTQGLPVDLTETDEALVLLNTDPQLLAQRMQQAIQAQSSIAASGRGGVASAKTEFLPGGGSLQALPSGEVVAKDEQGRVVEGQAIQDLLTRSKDFQLSVSQGKADISVDAETKKAAAKAGVELETKPEIQAAVTDAVSTVKARQKVAGEERSNAIALGTYETAMKGLLDSLSGTDTGPFVGLLPAITSNQQIAEGAIAAMGPVLKGLFRQSGEGTFTDKDQEILTDMIPTRTDRTAARRAKLQNIDAIIRSKLAIQAAPQPTITQPRTTQPAVRQPAEAQARQRIRFDAQGNIIQ